MVYMTEFYTIPHRGRCRSVAKFVEGGNSRLISWQSFHPFYLQLLMTFENLAVSFFSPQEISTRRIASDLKISLHLCILLSYLIVLLSLQKIVVNLNSPEWGIGFICHFHKM